MTFAAAGDDVTDHIHRRATDEIHGLLFDGKPVDLKAVLSVVANMNETLVALAHRLETHSNEVNRRLDKQDREMTTRDTDQKARDTTQSRLLNQAIGGYKVLSWGVAFVLTVFLTMGGYILNQHLDRGVKEIARNDAQDVKQAALETAQRVFETQLANTIGTMIDIGHRVSDLEQGARRPNVIIQNQERKGR